MFCSVFGDFSFNDSDRICDGPNLYAEGNYCMAQTSTG